jgi:peptidoglycan hydrolase-like protein with peptidoglycan-binding domain
MATLSIGSSGSEVRALQEKLSKLTIYTSAISGTFDQLTETAVKIFQSQHPWLLIDGIVGPMTLDEINDSISDLRGKATLQRIAEGTTSLTLADLQKDNSLCIYLQKCFRALGLYPGGKLVDGDFGPRSQEAFKQFCIKVGITVAVPIQLNPSIARILLDTLQIPSILRDFSITTIKRQIADFQQAVGASDAKLGFLDMGVDRSPFKHLVYKYSKFLDNTKSAGINTSLSPSLSFNSYPNLGVVPNINSSNLAFLPPDITQACVCIGKYDGGIFSSSWLGKNELKPVECLSATKIIPILNVLCQIGNTFPLDPSDLILKNKGSTARKFEFSSALIDICSYRISVPHSNALSATLNSLEKNRESWIKQQTGNSNPIQFGGKYGFDPTISVPELRDQSKNIALLSFQKTAIGGNSISAYDLTRFISLVGWHQLLSASQQLSSISQKGLNQAIIALGTDTARYVDTAISTLGLENVIESLIVLSKLGYGNSALVYTAFVQFIDRSNSSSTPKLRSFALTLRAAKNVSTDTEAIRVDSSIALAVTDILHRVVTDAF